MCRVYLYDIVLTQDWGFSMLSERHTIRLCIVQNRKKPCGRTSDLVSERSQFASLLFHAKRDILLLWCALAPRKIGYLRRSIMNLKIRRICFALLGIYLVLSAILTYAIQAPIFFYEMTFCSNLLNGVAYIIGAVLLHKKKNLPDIIFLIPAMAIALTFLISVGCTLMGMHFNFEGGFFPLHVINPILVFIFYFFFHDRKKFSIKDTLLSPLMINLYLIFDYIFFKSTGHFIYGILGNNDMGFPTYLLIFIITYAVIGAMGALTCFLQSILRKKNNSSLYE